MSIKMGRLSVRTLKNDSFVFVCKNRHRNFGGLNSIGFFLTTRRDYMTVVISRDNFLGFFQLNVFQFTG